MKRTLRFVSVLRGRLLRYYLLSEKVSGTVCYGICVAYGAETAEVRQIAVSGPGVRRLLRRLGYGRVTPATLQDVVEDWLLT